MSKHTPGPWRLLDDAQGPSMVMHPARNGVAIAALTSTFTPKQGFVAIEAPGAPERSANARLIAASPDLLDACTKALPLVSALCDAMGEACDEHAAEALHALRNAIAKATAGEG